MNRLMRVMRGVCVADAWTRSEAVAAPVDSA